MPTKEKYQHAAMPLKQQFSDTISGVRNDVDRLKTMVEAVVQMAIVQSDQERLRRGFFPPRNEDTLNAASIVLDPLHFAPPVPAELKDVREAEQLDESHIFAACRPIMAKLEIMAKACDVIYKRLDEETPPAVKAAATVKPFGFALQHSDGHLESADCEGIDQVCVYRTEGEAHAMAHNLGLGQQYKLVPMFAPALTAA